MTAEGEMGIVVAVRVRWGCGGGGGEMGIVVAVRVRWGCGGGGGGEMGMR